VGDVLFEDSPASAARVMANRAVISNGLATMSVANEWMPTIRATVFGIMLFMIPIALLFILTPINLRVASFALGMFVFVALWGLSTPAFISSPSAARRQRLRSCARTRLRPTPGCSRLRPR
jgi:thiol:disulfide interchange protein